LEKVDDPEEICWLRKFIERHRNYTGSERAKRLLEKWDDVLGQIVKVMPIEYRAVLEKMKNSNNRQLGNSS